MSGLAKGRGFVVAGEALNHELITAKLEELRAKPGFDLFKPFHMKSQQLSGVFGFQYGVDSQNDFWKRASEIASSFKDKDVVLQFLEQPDFLSSNWMPASYLTRRNFSPQWPRGLDVSFLFLQVAFLTKPWQRVISEELTRFSEKWDEAFYLENWKHYLIYLFIVLPGDKDLNYANMLLTDLVQGLLKRGETIKPLAERPEKLDFLYHDYEETIFSGLLASTTQGIWMTRRDVVQLSLHLEEEKAFFIIEPKS